MKIALILLAGLAAGHADAESSGAKSSGLEPLIRRDQLLGWEAVGRVDLGQTGFCTGALISTTLVLTAAHCVYGADGAAVDPGHITFRAGYADGQALVDARVARTVADPAYDATAPVSAENVRHDVALLELETPIPAALAAPFSVGKPGKGDQVSVVSYASGREEMLSWQRECQVVGRTEGLIATNCDVTFGASGAPVLDRSGARARIVSIISAGGPRDGGVISYGMDLPDRVAALKALLQRDTPLATANATPAVDAPKVSRLGIGTGDSRDIGARFVKP